MGLNVIAQPVEEAVELADLKQDLRIAHTDDDARLNRLNAEAREWVETRAERQLSLKTWEFTIDYFPEAEIYLPLRPVDAVVSVKYDDTHGLEQILLPSSYYLDNVSEYGWLFAVDAWPVTLDAVNAVRIVFTAGYSDQALVPAPLKSAVTLQVAELYDGPDATRQARIRDLLQNYYLMVA